MGKKLRERSSSSQSEWGIEGGRDAIVVWLASRPVRTVNELSLLLLLHANLIKSCNKIYGCLLEATLAGPQTSWIFLPAAGKGRRVEPARCQVRKVFAISQVLIFACHSSLRPPWRHFFAYMCDLFRLLLWLKTICGLWPLPGWPKVVGIF